MKRQTIALACCFLAAAAYAHAAEPSPQCPQTTSALYARIHSIGLDPQRVYHVRGATIDRPNLHIDFDDGTLAFTEDICGRTTGAFFDGEGEVRLRPPNRAERGSLALFTGMAILEEQFSTGYLRFNDDTAAVLQPFLTPAEDAAEFIKQWNDTSLALAGFDGLRLLLDFSHFLPTSAGNDSARNFQPLLHAHLLGKMLGGFEVVWDPANAEPLWAGQPRMKDGNLFFDIWTSFAPAGSAAPPVVDASITNFRIRASVEPPTRLRASTDVNVHILSGGERTLLFELSRYLKVEAIESDGRPVDFIQNPAIEGSELRRKGNDLVAVVFPAPLAPRQELKLHFRYAGDVLSEAGKGLLYVGERGTWYPNFGLSPAQFDIEFHYPQDWTLVATGKPTSRAVGEVGETNADDGTDKVSRWVSERPIPVAGFNLGKYVRAEARAGNVVVEAYGTKGVEKSFPKAQDEVVSPILPSNPRQRLSPIDPVVVSPPPPSPARDAQAVADRAALAITSFSQWFGPYPYDSLALTQMPGLMSQGWPGLVFLSSFAFLSPHEQADLHLGAVAREIDNQVLVHETAHQWWGDLVLWNNYRDQWISEGLANYASLLMLEQQNPVQFRQVLDKYRSDLLSKNNEGEWLRDAGPVTFGQRLDSSHFPNGYDEISYERGTWLFHMLRTMLRDAEAATHSQKGRPHSLSEEPFFRGLRKIRERYAGKSISTQELLRVFEEELPRPLWYENHHKLDWFLKSWIEGTAIPRLEAHEVHFNEKNGVTTVTGVIVQKDAPNDLVTAVPVYAAMPGNTLTFLGEVLADGQETAFHLPAPHAARKILLDPRQTILTKAK
ncbi:MAG: M1 family aminopeptidase [Terriglobales bacterium]